MVAACWLSDDSHEVFLLFLPLSWLAQKTCALPGWHVCLHAAGCTPSEAHAPAPSSTLFLLDLARPPEGHPLPPPVPHWTRSPSHLHFFIFHLHLHLHLHLRLHFHFSYPFSSSLVRFRFIFVFDKARACDCRTDSTVDEPHCSWSNRATRKYL